MFTFNTIKKSPQGFTFIELMTAISMSFILLIILLTCYINTVKSSALSQALNMIDANAKTVIDLIGNEVQQAGDIGCARLTNEFPLRTLPSLSYSPQTRIQGDDHALTIRSISWLITTIHAQPGLSRLVLDKTAHLHANDTIIVANCLHAELVKVAQVKAHTVLLQRALEQEYQAEADVGIVNINHYYIANTKRHDATGAVVYALYREDIKHDKMEMVSGIDELLFTYTLLQNGALLFDQKAAQINDWSQVVGVALRIHLHVPPLEKTRYAYFLLP